jgi:hypothetical protein
VWSTPGGRSASGRYHCYVGRTAVGPWAAELLLVPADIGEIAPRRAGGRSMGGPASARWSFPARAIGAGRHASHNGAFTSRVAYIALPVEREEAPDNSIDASGDGAKLLEPQPRAPRAPEQGQSPPRVVSHYL